MCVKIPVLGWICSRCGRCYSNEVKRCEECGIERESNEADDA